MEKYSKKKTFHVYQIKKMKAPSQKHRTSHKRKSSSHGTNDDSVALKSYKLSTKTEQVTVDDSIACKSNGPEKPAAKKHCAVEFDSKFEDEKNAVDHAQAQTYQDLLAIATNVTEI